VPQYEFKMPDGGYMAPSAGEEMPSKSGMHTNLVPNNPFPFYAVKADDHTPEVEDIKTRDVSVKKKKKKSKGCC